MSYDGLGGLPDAFCTAGTSSFTELLTQVAPELLPGRRQLGGLAGDAIPHATTIVAMKMAGGVVMGGDRRSTMGTMIANREIEKVFAADEHSLIGFAGAAGFGLELIHLFQLELVHYEKLEGAELSLAGKASRLSAMVRGNLGAAMQGLTALPLFAAFDPDSRSPDQAAKIVIFDVTGAPSEERDYGSIGSGSLFAKSSLKKLYRPGLTTAEAARLVMEALFDAADDDSATGGPDLVRQIFPVLWTATADGTARLTDAEVEQMARDVVASRSEDARD